MASLLDIGPLTEEVEIRGTKLTVQGLTAGHLFQLFSDFPDMRKLLDSGDADKMNLIDLAPDLIARIVVTATGSPAGEESEAKAKLMGAGEQLSILSAVQRLTFPRGIGPFLDQINQLMGSALPPMHVLNAMDAPPSLNSTVKSRALSSASLQTDTPGVMRGPQRRVN